MTQNLRMESTLSRKPKTESTLEWAGRGDGSLFVKCLGKSEKKLSTAVSLKEKGIGFWVAFNSCLQGPDEQNVTLFICMGKPTIYLLYKNQAWGHLWHANPLPPHTLWWNYCFFYTGHWMRNFAKFRKFRDRSSKKSLKALIAETHTFEKTGVS